MATPSSSPVGVSVYGTTAAAVSDGKSNAIRPRFVLRRERERMKASQQQSNGVSSSALYGYEQSQSHAHHHRWPVDGLEMSNT